MALLNEYLIQWFISNVVAFIFLIIAVRKPKLARLFFAILFAWACWINYTTAHNTPHEYLEYASFSPFIFLKNFINGWFKEHITTMVTLIAIGQGLIAIGMLLKGWLVRMACIGAIVFLLAITPLGVGAGFPSSVIAAMAIYFILKNDNLNYLWKFQTLKTIKTKKRVLDKRH